MSALAPPALAANGFAPGLANAAAGAGILFGASAAWEVLSDPAYQKLYQRHAKIITTDWALKFGTIRPDAKSWDFGQADQLLQFASANGMQMRGHALAWNENMPDWVRSLSAAEAARVFDEHIERTAGRYAGRLHSWDVVNEPFWPGHNTPGGFRGGPWLSALGPSYIERALRRANAADKRAKLVINEAHTEREDDLGRAIRKNLLILIDGLLERGAPLHAIGLQGHLQPQFPSSDGAYAEFLQAIAARNLDIYITEMDIDDSSLGGDPAAADRMAAARFAEYLKAVLSVRAVKVIQLWQFSDKYSWYRDPEVARQLKLARPVRPLVFDDEMREKPAAQAFREAFKAR